MRILYITGSDRSGTTLVDRTLGSMPGFASGGEIHHVFTRGIQLDEKCGCGRSFWACPFWQRVAARIGALATVDSADITEELKWGVTRLRHIPALLSPFRTPGFEGRLDELVGRLATLYGAIGTELGGRTLVDSSKHPGYAHVLHHVPGMELRVLHVVRDSRGVVHSWQRVRPRPEAAGRHEILDRPPVMKACWLWNLAHVGAETIRSAGLPYLRVRYEDFVRDLPQTAAKILEFAGGDPAPARSLDAGLVDFGVQHTVAGNPMRLQQGRIRLRLDDAWRWEMGRARILGITACTAPLLWRYGYRAY